MLQAQSLRTMRFAMRELLVLRHRDGKTIVIAGYGITWTSGTAIAHITTRSEEIPRLFCSSSMTATLP